MTKGHEELRSQVQRDFVREIEELKEKNKKLEGRLTVVIMVGDKVIEKTKEIECIHTHFTKDVKECEDCYELQKAIDRWNEIKVRKIG
jgi:hypothetical protein